MLPPQDSHQVGSKKKIDPLIYIHYPIKSPCSPKTITSSRSSWRSSYTDMGCTYTFLKVQLLEDSK